MWLGTLRVEPLFRQRVVEVYLGDGALLSCRQFSRPCSVEQRDARACAAHVAGVIWDQKSEKYDSVDSCGCLLRGKSVPCSPRQTACVSLVP